MADSIHDLFEADCAQRDLPSPYLERIFAKFEGETSRSPRALTTPLAKHNNTPRVKVWGPRVRKGMHRLTNLLPAVRCTMYCLSQASKLQ